MSQLASILNAKLTYLYGRTGGRGIRLGLDTTLALVRELGVALDRLPCIHVAGTNGKGSVCAMLESVLRTAGLRTGLYTSPHLIRFNERIRVDGAPIPDEDLSRLLGEVEAADARQSASGAPGARPGTFFELTTAVALKWFQEQNVQIAVLETGLGGRLDSTNIVTPLLSVITEIGIEHTDYLGTTLPEIAAEKAGIIKPSRPVVTGLQRPEAMAVIEARASETRSPLWRAADHVSIRRTKLDPDGQTLSVSTASGDAWPPFRLPLLGDWQLDNCAIALTALQCLEDILGQPLPGPAVRAGLTLVRWPGRCQILSRDPLVLLDSAHNPDAAAALAGFLGKFRSGRPVALLCGMLSDKDAPGFFRRMKPVVDACLLVPLDTPRNMPMDKLKAAAETAGIPAAEGTLPDGLQRGIAWAKKRDGILLCAGSLLLSSVVLNELNVPV
ncbi:MAG: bifunctional folylpolyglutamate synthase/dihydrofolate synthase [Kiritimatiellae bacterium]|nr:bifunctional folylpolyglutamate synthase/dihydrofolate synthase [Kiritimatiellia bacterium]